MCDKLAPCPVLQELTRLSDAIRVILEVQYEYGIALTYVPDLDHQHRSFVDPAIAKTFGVHKSTLDALRRRLHELRYASESLRRLFEEQTEYPKCQAGQSPQGMQSESDQLATGRTSQQFPNRPGDQQTPLGDGSCPPPGSGHAILRVEPVAGQRVDSCAVSPNVNVDPAATDQL